MRRLIAANKWEKYKTAKQIAICTFFFQPTYWTEDTEELRKRWNMTEEEIDSIKKNVKFIR